MPLVLGGSSGPAVAFAVDNSCRFDDADSSGLAKTFGTPTDRDTWTLSMWFKLGAIDEQGLFWATEDASNYTFMGLESSGKFTFFGLLAGGASPNFKPSLVFRDYGSWYHFVIAWDSGQATPANRIKFYVNGIQYTGPFDTETYPAQDANSSINGALVHEVAEKDSTAGHNFNGYMAETVFIDGTAYAASDFGEFDEDSPTIWKPKKVSGLTFGDNGFYLDYQDSAAFGNDVSGNNNDFTPSGLVAADKSEDSPSNNFNIMSPLVSPVTGIGTFSQGNTKVLSSTSAWRSFFGTLGPKAGKWYYEAKEITESQRQGWAAERYIAKGGASYGTNSYAGNTTLEPSYATASSSGNIYWSNTSSATNSTSYGGTYSVGDIVSIYLDLDNAKFYVAVNDVMQNSGTGYSIETGDFFIPMISSYTDGTGNECNFGNGCFGNTAVTSAVADVNGYGLFEYDPSRGGASDFDGSAKDFLAVCTKNLATDGG